MKITLFGATGKLGQALLKQGLAQGHSIKALVRSPEKIEIKHENLEVIKADVIKDDRDRLAEILSGSDAVISALGTGLSLKITKIYSEGTKKIIEAMEKSHTRRLIAVSSCGTEPTPEEPWWYLWIVRRLLINVYIDMTRMEDTLINAENLDWTIVRPSQLTNGESKAYRIGIRYCPVGGYQISRADVAGFMLQQLAEDKYVNERVALAY